MAITKTQNAQEDWTRVAVLLSICFVVCSILFLTHMEQQHMEENIVLLDNASRQYETALVKQVEGDFQTLRGVAVCLGEQDLTELDQLARLVSEVNEGNAFIRMGFATLDGQLELLELGGKQYQGMDIADEPFFQQAASGHDVISKAMQDPFQDDTYIHYYAVPVRNQNSDIVGVLCAVNDASVIREIIEAPLLNGTGLTVLYDEQGQMILRSTHLSLENTDVLSIETLNGLDEKARGDVQAAFRQNKSAHFTFRIGKTAMLAVLEPVGVQDWFILNAVSVGALRQRYLVTAVGAMLIIVAACGLLLLLLFQQRRMMERNQAVIKRLAFVDELTGGRNYNKFLIDAESVRKLEGQQAIWYCDLKKFKYYNDALGYQMGDEMLKQVYRLIVHMKRPEEVFCRMSADNFVGIRFYQQREELTEWFEALLEGLHQQESAIASRSYIELCMGFYCIEPGDKKLTMNEMVNRANMAQKSIKGASGSGCTFFTETLRQRSLQESNMEAEGKQALQEGQFQPYFQPKFDIQHENRLSGAEVLCRWVHPEKGLIPPNTFIPIFEKSGLIVQLDRYMFRKACEWYRRHLDQGGPQINLAINVSRVGLLREDFVEYYAQVKEEFALPDAVIELEVTESLALGGENLLCQLVCQLQERGFICSLDDFGSGYSSLNLLKNLPIKVLKLDILFFKRSVDKGRERIVVRHIINMAKELQIRVIAEGVEETESLAFLQDAGCDTVQGYIFAKPMPMEQFARLLRETKGIVRGTTK